MKQKTTNEENLYAFIYCQLVGFKYINFVDESDETEMVYTCNQQQQNTGRTHIKTATTHIQNRI